MSPVFLVNYITGRRQITNTKVDRWLSYIFSAKNYISRNNSRIVMFVCTTVLYEYMNLLSNDVRIKIYREFVHGINYIASKGRHVKMFIIWWIMVGTWNTNPHGSDHAHLCILGICAYISPRVWNCYCLEFIYLSAQRWFYI